MVLRDSLNPEVLVIPSLLTGPAETRSGSHRGLGLDHTVPEGAKLPRLSLLLTDVPEKSALNLRPITVTS